MLKTLANFLIPQLGSLLHVRSLQRLEACSKSLRMRLAIWCTYILASSPDFVLDRSCYSGEINLEVAWGRGYTVKRPACLCSGLGTRLHCEEASMLVQWPGDEATLWRGQHACAVAWGRGYTHTSVKRPACLCRSESSCLYVATLLTATLQEKQHIYYNFQIS